jgi:hypothetical protein
MVAIVFSRLHKKLLSLLLAFYVETHRGGDFRGPSYDGSPR